MNIMTAIYTSSFALFNGGDSMHGAEIDPFFIFAIAAVLLLGEGFFSGSKGKGSRRRGRRLETHD